MYIVRETREKEERGFGFQDQMIDLSCLNFHGARGKVFKVQRRKKGKLEKDDQLWYQEVAAGGEEAKN